MPKYDQFTFICTISFWEQRSFREAREYLQDIFDRAETRQEDYKRHGIRRINVTGATTQFPVERRRK